MATEYILYKVESGVRFKVLAYDTQEEADVDCAACNAVVNEVDEIDFIVVAEDA